MTEDLRRFLEDRPILARPPNTMDRLARWSRKHRGLIAAGFALLMVLVVALAVNNVLLARARSEVSRAVESEREQRLAADSERRTAEKQREAAEKARDEARQITDFLVSVFRSPDPYRDGRTITVAETLAKGVEQIDRELVGQPLVKAELLLSIVQTYHGLGLYNEAVHLAEQAHQLFVHHLGTEHVETLVCASILANAYSSAANFDKALALKEQTLELMRKVLGSEHPHTLTSMNNLANCFASDGTGICL